MKKFTLKPFYEKYTDSLIYYHKDERSFAKYVNEYLTLFLSIVDRSIIGFEITNIHKLIGIE